LDRFTEDLHRVDLAGREDARDHIGRVDADLRHWSAGTIETMITGAADRAGDDYGQEAGVRSCG
jgi:hypothetical protein